MAHMEGGDQQEPTGETVLMSKAGFILRARGPSTGLEGGMIVHTELLTPVIAHLGEMAPRFLFHRWQK